MMCQILSLVTLSFASTTWEYGDWVYYAFEPQIAFETKSDTDRALAMLPKPSDDAMQKLLGIYQEKGDRKVFERTDKSNENAVLGTELTLHSGIEETFSLVFLIARRSVRLSEPLLAGGAERLLPRERTRLATHLSLSESTGAGDRELLKQAAQEFSNIDPMIERARSIYDCVIGRMTYEQKFELRGAGRAWREGIGECCDYVALFASLCRLNDIPARNVTGFVFQNDTWNHHVWAEFYVPRLGWVPCDPSLGDAGPQAADYYFAGADDVRIAVSRGFDLDFSPPDSLKVELLQEYLYVYYGAAKPNVRWEAGGGRFDTLPEERRADFGRPVFPLPDRRRR